MVRNIARKHRNEAGQAVLLVLVAMSLFLLAGVGLAIDGSHLWAQRQMAQAAADAAAQAGIVSIFDGTNTGSNAFGSGSYTCSVTDGTSPCRLARINGFGTTAGATADTVFVEPDPAGVTVANLDGATPNLLRVTVTRPVSMTLTKFLGLSSFNVSARAMAAIVDVISPVPIIITHPTMAGALNMNGHTSITITGGPQRSIQINSSGTNPAGAAYAGPSSGSVDLSHAGPTGNGGDFGVFGGPAANPGNVNLGTLPGHYIDPADPIPDPLAGVAAPSVPSAPAAPLAVTSASKPNYGCTSSCTVYSPGLYVGGMSFTSKNSVEIFNPGVYYMKGGGFDLKNTTAQMCAPAASKTCPSDPTTVDGMLVYDTCSAAPNCPAGSDATGGFTIDTGVTATFLGAGVSAANPTAAPTSPYYGILFFEDRNANASTHNIGAGNGCFSIIGTIYITNTLGIMTANAAHYQTVLYHGTPCTGVQNFGEIIVSQLTVKGTSGIDMGIFPNGFLTVRQIALVN